MPSGSFGFSPTPIQCCLPSGWPTSRLSTSSPCALYTRTAPSVPPIGLVELEDDLGGLLGNGRPRLRRGTKQLRVGERRQAQPQARLCPPAQSPRLSFARARQRDWHSPAVGGLCPIRLGIIRPRLASASTRPSHHQASFCSEVSVSPLLGLLAASPARWRRTTSTKTSPSKTIATSATIAATGAFELSGTQNSCPSTTPFCAPTEIGTLQWKIRRALALVLDLRRRHGTHPMDAVVVPFEASAAIDHHPLGRIARARRGRHGHVAIEVRVQIDRR